MQAFMVLYKENPDTFPADAPLGFSCMAEDGDHAEEQCENAYPGCDVVWVVQTDQIQDALDDYYGLKDMIS